MKLNLLRFLRRSVVIILSCIPAPFYYTVFVESYTSPSVLKHLPVQRIVSEVHVELGRIVFEVKPNLVVDLGEPPFGQKALFRRNTRREGHPLRKSNYKPDMF